MYFFLLMHQTSNKFLFLLPPSFFSLFLQNMFTSYILPLFAHPCNKSSCPFFQNLFMLLWFQFIWKRVVIILICNCRINVSIIVVLGDRSFMLLFWYRVHMIRIAIFLNQLLTIIQFDFLLFLITVHNPNNNQSIICSWTILLEVIAYI